MLIDLAEQVGCAMRCCLLNITASKMIPHSFALGFSLERRVVILGHRNFCVFDSFILPSSRNDRTRGNGSTRSSPAFC